MGETVPRAVVAKSLESQGGWNPGSCSVTNSRVLEQTALQDGQLLAQRPGVAPDNHSRCSGE